MEKLNNTRPHIVWFENISNDDVGLVGGKNASLGEMYSELKSLGVKVPNGFAVTAAAYNYFLESSGAGAKLQEILNDFDITNTRELSKRGRRAREAILKANLPQNLQEEIIDAYHKLSVEYDEEDTDVAIRSSATAEDLPTASFAGEHETFLNVKSEKEVVEKTKAAFASLFTDRAISYRADKGFSHFDVALSVGIQKMVRSDLAASGVAFTLDPETGFRNVVYINSSWGLGEAIVQGRVNPDSFYVFKPTLKEGFKSLIQKTLGSKTIKIVYSAAGGVRQIEVPEKEQKQFSLTEEEVLTLARWCLAIERHYSKRAGKDRPMDIEWAKDGLTGSLFIVQARPETIHSAKDVTKYQKYVLKEESEVIVRGFSVGEKIASGKVRVLKDASSIHQFKKDEVLVTEMTDPDWEPIMKIAAAIVTDKGGRTSHAAIVSRELGIPAIVGSETATKVLRTGDEVTVVCAKGIEGLVYKGKLKYEIEETDIGTLPKPKTKIMVNIGNPEVAFSDAALPNEGVGLCRIEFVAAAVKVHPMALFKYPNVGEEVKKKIDETTDGYEDKKEFFIEKLAEGVGTIAAAFWPHDVIMRFSDFKTNEYRSLIGGEEFEPKEENPMIGWRGASRYYDPAFEPAFALEVEAVKRIRSKFGLKNLVLMIPFCRTPEEGEKVIRTMAKHGLVKGENNLKVYVMGEIPSNVILLDKFLDVFDGVSIGSNDLTQLVLGIDRDNAKLQGIANETNEAVKEMIRQVIRTAKKRKKYVGICGQAPSDHPQFAKFLLEEGIESISLNPDSVVKTILELAKTTQKS